MSEVVEVAAKVTEGVQEIMANRKRRREVANYFLVPNIPVHDSAGDLMDLCALRVMAGRDDKLRVAGDTIVETESEALGRKEGYSIRLTLLEPSVRRIRIQAFTKRPSDKVGSVTVSTPDGIPIVAGLEEHELGQRPGAWDMLLSSAVATVATELGWKEEK